jgi:hypothetical protein
MVQTFEQKAWTKVLSPIQVFKMDNTIIEEHMMLKKEFS